MLESFCFCFETGPHYEFQASLELTIAKLTWNSPSSSPPPKHAGGVPYTNHHSPLKKTIQYHRGEPLQGPYVGEIGMSFWESKELLEWILEKLSASQYRDGPTGCSRIAPFHVGFSGWNLTLHLIPLLETSTLEGVKYKRNVYEVADHREQCQKHSGKTLGTSN